MQRIRLESHPALAIRIRHLAKCSIVNAVYDWVVIESSPVKVNGAGAVSPVDGEKVGLLLPTEG
jgi:hypothetical protein